MCKGCGQGGSGLWKCVASVALTPLLQPRQEITVPPLVNSACTTHRSRNGGPLLE